MTNRKGHIKVLIPDFSGRGGHSQHCYCLCNALSSLVGLIYLVPRKYESAHLPHPFKVITSIEQVYDKKSRFLKGAIHLSNLFRIYRAILSNKVAIYHFHDLKLSVVDNFFLKLLAKRNVQVVYTAHNIMHHEKSKASSAVKSFYENVPAIIVHAEANKRELLNVFPLDASKVHVIPVGSYSAFFKSNKKQISAKPTYLAKLGLPKDRLTLLFFGYIRHYKGLDILLKAIRTLGEKARDVQLLIVGEPVEDFGPYQDLINSLTYPDHVHTVLKYISNERVADYLLASDAVVLPYRHIYQSGVVYLAYAHGRPVIATKVGGLEEVVDEGKTGFLIDPESEEQLASRIEILLNKPEMAARMGAFAHEESLTKSAWDWQNIAQQTIGVYEQVLTCKAQERSQK